jgi:hypothetical protein
VVRAPLRVGGLGSYLVNAETYAEKVVAVLEEYFPDWPGKTFDSLEDAVTDYHTGRIPRLRRGLSYSHSGGGNWILEDEPGTGFVRVRCAVKMSNRHDRYLEDEINDRLRKI